MAGRRGWQTRPQHHKQRHADTNPKGPSMPTYRFVGILVSVLRHARCHLRRVHTRLVRVSLHVRLSVVLAIAVRRIVNDGPIESRVLVRRVDHEVGCVRACVKGAAKNMHGTAVSTRKVAPGCGHALSKPHQAETRQKLPTRAWANMCHHRGMHTTKRASASARTHRFSDLPLACTRTSASTPDLLL